MVQHNAHIKM